MNSQNQSEIERLKASPFFNLSLASKELFHSNFLAWLGNQHPEVVEHLFCDLFQLGNQEKLIKVYREKKSIDLIFDYATHLVVVENKVRSIATKQQLERIQKKALQKEKGWKGKPVTYFLLSMIKPRFFQNNELEIDGETWKFLDYSILLNALETIKFSESAQSQYYKFLLNDYIQSTRDLSILTSQWKLGESEKLIDRKMRKEIEEIRCYDLYDKLRYSQFASLLVDKSQGEWFFDEGHYEERKIYVKWDFTHTHGLCHIKMKIKDFSDQPFFVGMQIQEGNCGFFVSCDCNDRLKEIAVALRKDNLWFDFPDENLDFHGFEGNTKATKKGEPVFLYHPVKLNDNWTILQIRDYLIPYVDEMKRNYEKFKAIS